MGNRIYSLSVVAVLLAILFLPLAAAQAQTSDSNLLVRAQEEFSKQQYTKALILYRKYLRTHPDDQDAWARFAATYYHTGQAEQALQYLLKSKSSSSIPIFNLYYRGLSYDALGDPDRARSMLSRVSKYDTPLAEDALFEKAAIEFGEGDAGACKVTVEAYRRRFKSGRFKPSIDFMLAHLAQAGKVEVPESQRTIYRKSYFVIHPYSLMNIPHGWVYQLGFDTLSGTRMAPAELPQPPVSTPGVKKEFEEFKLIARAGLSLGPYLTNSSSSTMGYLYSQEWFSDSDRKDDFLDSPDINTFPFRPDLLERTHRLYVDSSGHQGPFAYGVYAHLEFRRGGSSLFPAPERPEIRKAFDIGTSTYVMPWGEFVFLNDHKVRLLTFFDKFIDIEQNDFSFKTYNLLNGIDDPRFSFALQQESQWKSIGLTHRVEVFEWTYLYNDYWEGYTVDGAAFALDFDIAESTYLPAIRLGSHLGYAEREYTYNVVRSTGCKDGQSTPNPTTCKRLEPIINAGASISMIGSLKQHALTLSYEYRDRNDDLLKVYNETSHSFVATFTQAFPSLQRGASLIEAPRGLYLSRGSY